MQTTTSALARHGHIATRAQLIAAGFSGTDLTRAVRTGEIRRIRRAHYATPQARPDAADAVRVGGKLAGASAAASWGLWSGTDERLHVAVAANASRLRTNRPVSMHVDLTPDTSYRMIALHWIEDYQSDDCWRVSLPAALRQTVAWCDRETALACLDTTLSTFNWTKSQLQSVFTTASPSARMLAAEARHFCDSGTESIVRQRLLAIGIECAHQVRIPVVRLSYLQVTTNWPWCERMILAALSQFRS